MMYGDLYRKILYPAWEGGVNRRPTVARLAYLEQTQWRSRDELDAIQAGELRRLVRHAWTHVPFYRARFEQAGVGPDDVRGAGDLAKLPLLTREDAIAAGDTRKSVAAPLPTIAKSTSGSSGTPLKFAYEPDSDTWRQAVKLRGYGWSGYRAGDPTLFYWGAPPLPAPPRTRMKIALDRASRREVYVDCTPRGDADFTAVVDTIRRMRPTTIVAYTQAAAELSRWIIERGARSWGVIPVLCAAERLYPGDRRMIETAFGEVFETYGSREVMLISAECVAHAGMHVSHENLIVEIVVRDPATGRTRAAQPGETGEVVLTDLHNHGMPFIRYQLGDLATVAAAGPCPCGRALPRLASVDGRLADTLRDGSGRSVGGLVFNLIVVALADKVRQFQAVQKKDGSVTLKIVPTPLMDDVAKDHLRRHCEKYLPGVSVALEIVDTIPPAPNGKRKVVVVES